MTTDLIRAPWTADQAQALNAFQQSGRMHPFTCGLDSHGVAKVLIATEYGWRCPDEECDYRQDWAHAFMAAPAATPAVPVPPATTTTDEERRQRYAYAIREAGETAYGNRPFYEAITVAVMAVADAEQAELRRERDLAIAHDRQPYPTAWAYEQACKALHRKTDTLDRVREFLKRHEHRVAVSPLDVLALLDDSVAEAPQPEPAAGVRQPDTETHDACTCAAAGDAFVPAGHYADCPQADQPAAGAQAPAGDADCERCDGSGLDPDAYFKNGDTWTHAPCRECQPEDDETAARRAAANTQPCGAWGGCPLPRGHNMGQADIPENHQPAAGAGQHRAATVDPAMCPRCKGDNSEAFELCATCAAGAGQDGAQNHG